jgi:hypothetical protein
MGMISKPQAFTVGHNLSYCAVYFDQVLLAAKLANSNSVLAKQHAQQMIASLQRVGNNFAHRLQSVEECAQIANFSTCKTPTLPPEFYPWIDLRHGEFLHFWPALDPRGSLFVIGHAIGEFRNGLIIANLTMDFTRNLQLDFTKQQSRLPKRITDSLMRFERALSILEHLPSNEKSVEILRPFLDGIQPQLQTSLALMKLQEKATDKAFSFNHKLLNILGNAEFELAQHLS